MIPLCPSVKTGLSIFHFFAALREFFSFLRVLILELLIFEFFAPSAFAKPMARQVFAAINVSVFTFAPLRLCVRFSCYGGS